MLAQTYPVFPKWGEWCGWIGFAVFVAGGWIFQGDFIIVRYLVVVPFGVAWVIAWRQHRRARKQHEIYKLDQKMKRLESKIRDLKGSLLHLVKIEKGEGFFGEMKEDSWKSWPQREAAEYLIESIVERVLDSRELRRKLEDAEDALSELEEERERLDPNYRRPSEEEGQDEKTTPSRA